MIIIRGESIKELIPQREPMIMIDTLYDATELEADTGLTVIDNTLFCSEGMLSETGLIEHIAQSALAFAGYKAKLANKSAPLGFIGEVKKCRICYLPRAGDVLHTHLRVLSELFDVTLLVAETVVNDNISVQCQMKIFIKQP